MSNKSFLNVKLLKMKNNLFECGTINIGDKMEERKLNTNNSPKMEEVILNYSSMSDQERWEAYIESKIKEEEKEERREAVLSMMNTTGADIVVDMKTASFNKSSLFF